MSIKLYHSHARISARDRVSSEWCKHNSIMILLWWQHEHESLLAKMLGGRAGYCVDLFAAITGSLAQHLCSIDAKPYATLIAWLYEIIIAILTLWWAQLYQNRWWIQTASFLMIILVAFFSPLLMWPIKSEANYTNKEAILGFSTHANVLDLFAFSVIERKIELFCAENGKIQSATEVWELVGVIERCRSKCFNLLGFGATRFDLAHATKAIKIYNCY